MRFPKFVKLYAYNSLTNFEYEVHKITGNGTCVNRLKICLQKIRKITSSKLIFGGLWPSRTTLRPASKATEILDAHAQLDQLLKVQCRFLRKLSNI
jgi:hypothetical protein